MLTKYIEAAMKKAHYELIEDGTYWGSIPGFEGVWGNADALERCRDELQSSLEDWLLFKLWLGDDDFPVLGKLSLCRPKRLPKREPSFQTSARKAS